MHFIEKMFEKANKCYIFAMYLSYDIIQIIKQNKHTNMIVKNHITEIPYSYFNTLLRKSQRDTGNDTELIGLSSKHSHYEMNVYAEAPTYEVQIEDFGYMSGDDWIQLEPTQSQLTAIKARIQKELKKIEYILKEEEAAELLAVEEAAAWEETKWMLYNSVR